MRVIPPIIITDAMLTSTTVTETYPTVVWSGATTYNLNDIVYIAGVNQLRTAYKSLQGSNTNNPPATSPTWWVNIGDMYPEYAGGTSYALAARVMVSATHLIYESLVASNLGNPVSDTTKWLLIGPTNRWAMFDTLRNTQTEMGSPLTVVLTPGRRIDSIALLGLQANNISISITSGGPVVYSESFNLNTREVTNWYDYFYQPFSTKLGIVKFNIPTYTNAIITITLTANSGNVKCGAIVIGQGVFIGDVQYEAESDVLNFSTVTRNFAGNVNVLVQRRNVPKTIQAIWLDKKYVNQVRALRDSLNAVPAIWAGVDNSDHEYFESLLMLGIYRRFSINLKDFSKAIISLELEEI